MERIKERLDELKEEFIDDYLCINESDEDGFADGAAEPTALQAFKEYLEVNIDEIVQDYELIDINSDDDKDSMKEFNTKMDFIRDYINKL